MLIWALGLTCALSLADLPPDLAGSATALSSALTDPVTVVLGRPRQAAAKQENRLEQEWLREDADHEEGVFWQDGASTEAFFNGFPCLTLWTEAHLRVLTTPSSCRDVATAYRIAQTYSAKYFPWMRRLGRQLRATYEPVTPVGVVAFTWEYAPAEADVTGELYIAVRLADGAVVAFLTSCTPGAPLLPTEPPAEVVQEPIEMRPPADSAPPVGALQPDSSRPSPLVSDAMPVWTRSGLWCVSQRPLAGFPSWFRQTNQVVQRAADGSLAALTADAVADNRQFLANPAGDGLSVARFSPTEGGFAYAVATRTGAWRRTAAGVARRPGAAPSPDGHWGICPDVESANLFVDDLTRAASLPERRGRVVLPGGQGLTCFSPDGEVLYFCDRQEPSATSRSRLVRVPTTTILAGRGRELREEVEDLVCAIPDRQQRLSITPNGQRLIVQAADGIHLVDVPAKTCRKLDLGALVDPDLKLPVTEPTDAWAGPGDDQVTFSGQTTTADGQVRRRIYCCRFDGTALQALTPADNAPVPLYTFPETKKTALELAKEWALEEVRYEQQWRAERERRR